MGAVRVKGARKIIGEIETSYQFSQLFYVQLFRQ
jgi:hypothetical protein